MDMIKVTYHTINAEERRKHIQNFTTAFCARRFANIMRVLHCVPVCLRFDASIDAGMEDHGNGHYSMVISPSVSLSITWSDVEDQIEEQIQELLALSEDPHYWCKAVQIQQLLAVTMGQQQEVHLLAEAERKD